MSESKHTPLIALINNLGLGHYGDIVITTQERIDKNEAPIASDIIDKAAAMEIVKRSNSHDKLLEACKRLIQSHGMHGPCSNHDCSACEEVYNLGKAAIAEVVKRD